MELYFWRQRHNWRGEMGDWETFWTHGDRDLENLRDECAEECSRRYDEGYRGTDVERCEPTPEYLAAEERRLRAQAGAMLRTADELRAEAARRKQK